MADPKLIEALSNASSLELFELSNIVDRLLADPRRTMAIRQQLNLGKAVQFMDWRTGQMRSGKVVELKSNQAPVHRPGSEDFHRCDKVSFTDKYLQPQVGIITRINQRTATVDCEGGASWRVPFSCSSWWCSMRGRLAGSA